MQFLPVFLLLLVACKEAPADSDSAPLEAADSDSGGLWDSSGNEDSVAPEPDVSVGCVGNTTYSTSLPYVVDPSDAPVLIGWYAASWILQEEARGEDVATAEIVGIYQIDVAMQPIVSCQWYDLPVAGDVPAWSGYAVNRWEIWE